MEAEVGLRSDLGRGSRDHTSFSRFTARIFFIGRVVRKHLGCGDLTKGFARVCRNTCRHESLLAFVLERSGNPARSGTRADTSAQPAAKSASSRSGLGWPTRSSPPCRTASTSLRSRRWSGCTAGRIGACSESAAEALKTLFRAASKNQTAVPGIIIAIQTFGDLVNFHPHLHAPVTDRMFSPAGWFVAFPEIDLRSLEQLFCHRVLQTLLPEGRIDEAVAEYILRSPFSQEKLRYQAKTGTIIYRAKMHRALRTGWRR